MPRQRYLVINGERKTIAEWAKDPRCAVSRSAFEMRLKRGHMTPWECLIVPRMVDNPGGGARFHPAARGLTKDMVRVVLGKLNSNSNNQIERGAARILWAWLRQHGG